MQAGRWLVGLGALLVVALALYVLTAGKPNAPPAGPIEPAMDEIDAEDRRAMRELLREAGED